MSFAEVCALALQQQAQIQHISAVNAKMAHEMVVLRRLKFAATSERFNPEQKSLLEEVSVDRRPCWRSGRARECARSC